MTVTSGNFVNLELQALQFSYTERIS